MSERKKEYINAINELVNNCEDFALLDLVYKLMKKSEVQHG